MDLIDSKIEYLKIKLCTELLILVGSKTEVDVLEGIIQSSKAVLENNNTKTMTVDHISATEEGKIRACFKMKARTIYKDLLFDGIGITRTTICEGCSQMEIDVDNISKIESVSGVYTDASMYKYCSVCEDSFATEELQLKKYNATYPLRLEKLYRHLSKIAIPEELRVMYVLILRKIAGKARPTPLEKVGLEIVHNEIDNLIINLKLEKL